MRYTRFLLIVAVAAVVSLAVNGGTGLADFPITVNSTAGDNDGICAPLAQGDCTLPEAIGTLTNLATMPHVTINFDPVVFAAPAPLIYPDANLPIIHANLIGGFTLDGTGADVSIVKFPGKDPNWPGLAIEGDSTHAIEIKNIEVWGFDREGIYICGGLTGGSCTAPLANVTLTNVVTNQNKLTGITIKGTDVSNVLLDNVEARQNGFGPEGPVAGVFVQGANSITDLAVNGRLISQNAGDGLEIAGGTTSNVSISSLQASLNHFDGVRLTASSASMHDVTLDNVVALQNGAAGIRLASTAALTQSAVTNSATNENASQGIFMSGGFALEDITVSDNQTQGNLFGIGLVSLAAASDVHIEGNESTDNQSTGIYLSYLQGGGTGNLIRTNTVSGNGAGIVISGNDPPNIGNITTTISRNATYGNAALGINLVGPSDPSNGVTLNDPGDGDTGPNGLLNYPLFTGGSGQAVTGTACANCLVELFLSDGDPSGHGEGQTFLRDGVADSIAVAGFSDGGAFSISICGLHLTAGSQVTATATDEAGNTSEFSNNMVLPVESGECPGTPTPSPTVSAHHKQGDLDCSGDVNGTDAIYALRFLIKLAVPSKAGCPAIGSGSPKFGDVNCDGLVNALDALAITQFWAGATVNPVPPGNCTPLGQDLP